MVFGYRMELGDIVPSPNEAETVRYIYTRYLAGASFQCLANELNQKAIPYHTGKSWNKNMVARILEDSRYVGADLYPTIISAEQLQAVRKNTLNSLFPFIISVLKGSPKIPPALHP